MRFVRVKCIRKNQQLPVSYLLRSLFWIISRTALSRVKSNSGSLFENSTITGFHSSRKTLKSWPDRFSSSVDFEESKALSKNSSSTDEISAEKEGYNSRRLLTIFLILLLEPEITKLQKYHNLVAIKAEVSFCCSLSITIPQRKVQNNKKMSCLTFIFDQWGVQLRTLLKLQGKSKFSEFGFDFSSDASSSISLQGN